MPRSEVREILSPTLSGPSCALPSRRAAAWEIEHYESNVESFSAEEPESLCHCTVGCKGGGAIMGN